MKLDQLIKPDKYQVFLLNCPAIIPFNFAHHHWFVINRMGEISRWEVGHRIVQRENSWGHLHKNLLEPTSGIQMLLFSEKYHWGSKLLGHIEGEIGSTADKMPAFLDHSNETYPYCYKYSLPGPNSNTYVQWALNAFPDFQTKLPFNAIGKGFSFLDKK